MGSTYDIKSLTVKIQSLFMLIIGCQLLWPWWESTALSTIFSIVCFAMTLFSMFVAFGQLKEKNSAGVLLGYASFIIWSAVMMVLYNWFYNVRSTSTLLFITMDASAMFFVMVLVSVFPCMLFADLNTLRMSKLLKILIFLVLVTTLYFSMRAVAISPNAIRASRSFEEAGYGAYLVGTPGYSHIYSYMLLIPVFLGKCYQTKRWNRLFYALCLGIMVYNIAISQLATALLLTVVGVLVFYFVKAKSVGKVFFGLLIAVFVYMLIFTESGSDFFVWLSERVEGDWSQKLIDMANTLVDDEASGMVSGRTDLYSLSFSTFLESPLIGKFGSSIGGIGGHATAIDILGLTGIFGFVFFSGTVYGAYARMKKSEFVGAVDNRPVITAVMLQFVILVFTKNIITALAIFFTFFALIPLLLKAEEPIHEQN